MASIETVNGTAILDDPTAIVESEALDESLDVDITGSAEAEAVDPNSADPASETAMVLDAASESEAEAKAAADLLAAEELTRPETYIGNSPNKATWMKVRDKAEKLFGHKHNTFDIVDFCFLVLELLNKEFRLAESKGEKFSRPDFIDLATNYLRKTTSIPPSQVEPSRWLQVVGLVQMVRGFMDEKTGKFTWAKDKPEKDWFCGNLTYTTLKALAPLVRVEKGSGVDTYSWAKDSYATVAIDMVRDLRSGTLACSYGYVEKIRNDRCAKIDADESKARRRTLSPDQVEDLEREEQRAMENDRRTKVERGGAALSKIASENGFDKNQLREKLVNDGVIRPLSAVDMANALQNETVAKTFGSAAMSVVATRKYLLAAVSEHCTHQDVTDLYNGILARLKANPRDASTLQALKAFKTCADKLAAIQQKRQAS